MSVLPKNFSTDVEVKIEDLEFDLPDKEDFCDYAYDFHKNELKTEDGKHYYVYGNEALKIWIYKAVRTDRFRYRAYSDQFGTEVFTLVGEVISDKLKKEEIKRYIIETLIVHPSIVSIDKIELREVKSVLEADVYFTSVFEDRMEHVICTVPI
ncbi:MAG: DUF2634 domain-containing protein [Tissierellia bacterium]|nr:DUF2634 domain-containing protein [Tissierellia bacterium]